MMIKFDEEFCKNHNIDLIGRPIGRLHSITRNDCTKFTILPQDKLADRYWERCDELLPTQWAVFAKSPDGQFWQQVSKWYFYYGNAVRMMGDLAKDV